MKKLSVICSIYNGEKFLHGFLENVLEQDNLNDFEFLLLDANSNDSTEEIIKKYKHPSLIYKKIDSRISVTETMNLGCKLASSDILTIWNIDDRRNINSLSKMTSFIKNNNHIDILYGYVAVSNIANEKFIENDLFNIYPCYQCSFDLMMTHNSPHCMPMWRKSLHNRFGYFNTEYSICSDYEFWLRCLVGGANFEKFYEIIGLYYYNPHGLSTNSQTKGFEEVAKIREIYSKNSKKNEN